MRTLSIVFTLLVGAALPAHAQYENFNNPALESEMTRAMMLPTVIVDLERSLGSGTIIFSEYVDLPVICKAEAQAFPKDPLCAGKTENQKQVRTYVLTAWHVLEKAYFPPPEKKDKNKNSEEKNSLIAPMEGSPLPTLAPPSSGPEHAPLPEPPQMVTMPPKIEIIARVASSTGAMDIDFVHHHAALVAYDAVRDLALLRVTDGAVLPYVANVAPRTVKLQPFRKVWAIGAPLGIGPEVTEGTLSGTHEQLDKQILFLSSPPIYLGNSGGGLFHWSPERNHFELIGVNNMIGGGIPHIVLSVSTTDIHDFLSGKGFDFITK